MATAAVNSTTSTDASITGSLPSSNAVSDAKETSDRFLKLLVAQMQNQDPLNPMDNAQVTTQMAQINTVSGIEKLNTSVQTLSTQFAQMQAVQGAGLVGHDVIVAGNRLDVDAASGVGQGGFELSTAADAVKVDVLSPSGQVLKSLNLGAAGAGMHSFDWTEAGAAGQSNLTFRVTATRGGVSTVEAGLMRDRVDAVTSNGTSLQLELAISGSVSYDAVKAFN